MITVPEVVYHYCSLSTFMSIISSKTLRMTNITKSNDCRELEYCAHMYGSRLEKKFSQPMWEAYYQKDDPSSSWNIDFYQLIYNALNNAALTYYTACFSSAPDKLSQWRGYAGDGCGIAIGFSTQHLQEKCRTQSKPFRFKPINYSNDLGINLDSFFPGASERIGPTVFENALLRIISKLTYNAVFLKHPSFAEEEEWRFVFYPFGQITDLRENSLQYNASSYQHFFDMMNDHMMPYSETNEDLKLSKIQFLQRGNAILSYVDMDFSQIRRSFIKEIVFGPKCRADDVDLRLFLLDNCYDINSIRFSHSISTYR